MRPTNIVVVYLTLLIALVCQLFPWVGQGIIFRPDFMLIVTLYWVLRAPHLCNIGTAWFVGILVDLATGSLLGQHALSFTLVAFMGLSFQRRLVLFNPLQLAGYVFALLVIERLVMLLLKLFEGNDNPGLHYFWPVISGLLLWQLMILLFGALTRPKS
ncbi:rod shape-determining protein MreD [Methylotenera versatilis]|uniref:rod shape-determining protein MreD n=1 Tax=Methylotenera versatilis TaxID=1055487 RepID=UPI0006455D5A|nr:rod shape-determining protein MreD [Methylotenera versatilis]